MTTTAILIYLAVQIPFGILIGKAIGFGMGSNDSTPLD